MRIPNPDSPDRPAEDPYEFADDEKGNTDELETDMLTRDDYAESDRFGMTQEEAMRGESNNQLLSAERPETTAWVDDEWQDGPDPQAGALELDPDTVLATEIDPDVVSDEAVEQSFVHVVNPDADPDAEWEDTDTQTLPDEPADPSPPPAPAPDATGDWR